MFKEGPELVLDGLLISEYTMQKQSLTKLMIETENTIDDWSKNGPLTIDNLYPSSDSLPEDDASLLPAYRMKLVTTDYKLLTNGDSSANTVIKDS